MDFADKVTPHIKRRLHFVGHSTAAVAVLDYLLTNGDSIFDRVVLAAPLVHCSAWRLSRIGCHDKNRLVKSVPRVFRKNSSDAEFLDFIKNKDRLQIRTIPLKWVRALHKWNDKIINLQPCGKKVKIIQGTSDKTVDWRFNIRFIQEKFSNAEVSLIENADHELFNESADMRNEIFSQIKSYFDHTEF